VADYQAMKERTAAEFASGGIPAYADAKEPWFDKAFAEMERWASRVGWQP
jgi:dephospho-CoA kinase